MWTKYGILSAVLKATIIRVIILNPILWYHMNYCSLLGLTVITRTSSMSKVSSNVALSIVSMYKLCARILLLRACKPSLLLMFATINRKGSNITHMDSMIIITENMKALI